MHSSTRRGLVILVLFATLGLLCADAAAQVEHPARGPQPYTAFLWDVVNLDRLAEPPVPEAVCRQFSSYDRASHINEKGEQVHWGANKDYGNYLRTEGDECVMAEMNGPGAIVRIWSANPGGNIRIYLDRSLKPVLDVPFADLCAGKAPGIPQPFVGFHARGANCWLPITYRKACKVTCYKNRNPKRMYYYVDYWTLPLGTNVETFQWPLTKEQRAEFDKVLGVLKNVGQAPPTPIPADKKEGANTLKPKATAELASLTGPGRVTALRLNVELPEDKQAARERLRSLWLTIRFDAAAEPQVSAPVGDFFGTAPGLNKYKSLPLGMTDEWLYCYWRMPFTRQAVVSVENPGDAPVKLKWQMESIKADVPKTMMHFHAKWKRDDPNQTFDWPFLEATGRGRYVGVAMNVWNPKPGWWGEGDEKVWVDGEKFPSWYGTGSEDYFGYAWCNTSLFHHALHNQTICEGPRNGNHSSVNRWHIADNIPFQKSFKITIENYARDVDYSCVAYWYATPETTDTFKVPVPPDRRHVHELMKPFEIPGAIEGESMKICGRDFSGEIGPQDLNYARGKWSKAKHLWFRPSRPGCWIELEFPVAKEGRYEVVVYLTKAIDYGIVEFAVNGHMAGEPYDAFNNGVVPSGPVSLGEVDLKIGTNKLLMTVNRKNKKSTGLMAGLDCIVLKKK